MIDWIDEAETACAKFRELGNKSAQYWVRSDVLDFERAKETMHTALPRALAALRAADELEKYASELLQGLNDPAFVLSKHANNSDFAKALIAYRKARGLGLP